MVRGPDDVTQAPLGATRITWSRSVAGHDEAFKRALIAEIVSAIAKASMVTDANVMAIRTGETLGKRIRGEVAKARAEGFCSNFVFGARQGRSA
jgi:hypothetical protein